MSLESFIGLDQGEPMSEAAFEKFKEKMARAQAQIAQIQKEEGKQKKKEQDLLKILSQFVRTSHKSDLVLLITRVLEQNIPANFVLAIVVLGNEDIQRAAGKEFLLMPPEQDPAAQPQPQTQPQPQPQPHDELNSQPQPHDQLNDQPSSHDQLNSQPQPHDQLNDQPSSHDQLNSQSSPPPQDRSLIFFSKDDESLPLKVKIEVDNWIKGLLIQAEDRPHKLLKNAYFTEMIELPKEHEYDEPEYEQEKRIKQIIYRLMAKVLQDFLNQNNQEEEPEKLKEFCKFILKGILNKTQENLDNRQELEGELN